MTLGAGGESKKEKKGGIHRKRSSDMELSDDENVKKVSKSKGNA